jgi:hypothetical protein
VVDVRPGTLIRLRHTGFILTLRFRDLVLIGGVCIVGPELPDGTAKLHSNEVRKWWLDET